LALEAQKGFWCSIFSQPSKVDERPVQKTSEDWSIVESDTHEDVAKAIHDSDDSVLGPDGVTLVR